MNQVLVEYTKRFRKPDFSPQLDLPKFFTQLDVENYYEFLPYLNNIQAFCMRLLLAKILNQRVCIYSDYDTDAITATATMYFGLLELGFDKDKLDFYAPDRFTEGYGMNTEATERLAREFDLIVSVDCGINSTVEAEIVKNTGCDLIITDHHHLHGAIPDCVAVLNPRLGEYYNESPKTLITFLTKTGNWKKSLPEYLTLLKQNLDQKQNEKLLDFLVRTTRDPKEFQLNSDKFMSASVTGVGVAWFCVVWLGYFLEVMES
jgi:DHH family